MGTVLLGKLSCTRIGLIASLLPFTLRNMFAHSSVKPGIFGLMWLLELKVYCTYRHTHHMDQLLLCLPGFVLELYTTKLVALMKEER